MGYNPLVNGVNILGLYDKPIYYLLIHPLPVRDIQVIAEMIQFNEKIIQFGGSTRDLTCKYLVPSCPKPATRVAASTTPKNHHPRSFAIRGSAENPNGSFKYLVPETKSCVCFICLSFGGYIYMIFYGIHTYIHVTYAFNTYVPNLYRLISFSQGVLHQFFCF